MRAAALTETCATRVMIQPGRAVTTGKRLLSLSVGWLLDRGFMCSLVGYIDPGGDRGGHRGEAQRLRVPVGWAIYSYPVSDQGQCQGKAKKNPSC
jgi:hypothetical protein